MANTSKPEQDRVGESPRAQKPAVERNRPAHDESKRSDAESSKATQFDGDPNPVGADRSAFKPKDDTPTILDKKSGPRTGRA